MKTYFELQQKKNTANQNLWDAAKVVLIVGYIDFNAYIIKQENPKIN